LALLFIIYSQLPLHVQGQTLILNKTFPEFFSEALKKTRSMCKLNVLWYVNSKHMQGQTLIL
ncbi:MAG: hypothetical protein ACI4LR_00985, partial [Treponema sp.]